MSLLNKASLIQIPSGYKDGTLYSAKPTNGDGDFTFSRGSNLAATRVNSEGLIEKGRENLLLQSNTFDTTWALTAANITSGQADKDGGTTAWLLERNGSVNGRVAQNVSTSGVNTFSLYAKSGSFDWLIIRFDNLGERYFDLNNGELGGSRTAAPLDSSIESVGNGWYRCSIVTNGSSANVRIYAASSNLDTTGTNGTIYIQDAQLEQGLVATDYIETGASTAQAGILEDMPRLDYSGGATCPSLLLEPQRSNLLTQSEYFESWTTSGNITISTNEIISPEGLKNAAIIDFSSATSSGDGIYAFAGNPSTAPSRTIYLKGAVGGETLDFSDPNQGGGQNITLTTEWQRFEYTGGTGGVLCGLWLKNSVGNVIHAYGAQVEEGSYPTSYIPTYGAGASVTRGAEILQISGMSNDLASGVSSATLFMDFEFQKEITADTLTFRSSTTALGRGYLYDKRMGMADSYAISITLTENTQQKCIWRLNTLSNATVFANGTKGSTGNGNTWSDVDTIVLLGSRWSMKIKQITLFNSALSDDECIQLTTI